MLAGYEPGDATWAPPPAEPFAASAAEPPRALRIACPKLPPVADAAVDPVCAQAVDRAAEQLAAFGHELVEFDPPWLRADVGDIFGVVFASHVSLLIAYSGRIAGRDPQASDMEPMSWAIYSMVARIGAIDQLGANVRMQSFAREVVSALQPFDVLLTPALAERPLALGTLDTYADDPMSTFTRSGLFTPFTPDRQRDRPARDLGSRLPGRGRAPARRAADRQPGRGGNAARALGPARRRRCRGPIDGPTAA